MDIHNYKGRYERTLQRIKEFKEITDDNKEIILKFNELLIKILCHNIYVVIQEVCELGIKAEFKLERPISI